MTKTKHPYLKEILKTTAKVALIAAGTYFVAAPFIADATAVFLNMFTAGTVAEIAVNCVGAYVAVKTLAKDIFTMRERVQKQQREEHVDKQLEELKNGLKKKRPPKATNSQKKQIQPKTTQKQAQTKKKMWNPLLWRKAKEYDRAA